MRGAERMGVRPPTSPTQENLLFNTAQATVTLLVEAGSDRRFWERWIAEEGVLVRDMGQGGRPKVEQELARARSTPGAWVVAVVDADLDRLTGSLTASPDLIYTDAHDLEATLIGGPALEEVSRYHGLEALRRAEAEWGEPLRQRLLRLAEGLGRLRWLKVACHPRLDELRFKKKEGESSLKGKYRECAEPGWNPSLDRAVRVVCNVSQAQRLLPPNRDLAGEATALGPADLSQLCNGHDLVGFLQAWLEEVGGKTAPEVDELAVRLALACSEAWVASTQMVRGLQSWERVHAPRRVLRDLAP